MRLSNGATPLTAFLASYPPSKRREGVVLAQWGDNYVTWDVQKREGEDTWDCHTGHYFSKGIDIDRQGKARQLAETDFGKRLARILPTNMYNGLKEGCGDASQSR